MGALDGKSRVGSDNEKKCLRATGAFTVRKNSGYYIRVKPGVYSEYVVMGENKTNIALIGDDATTTKIMGNWSNATGFGTLRCLWKGFIGQSLTIENSAPINSHQVVALYNNADHSAFYKCIFMGYPDTLLANKNSQFYKNCEISGIVDFIFGYASAVFQDCGIYVH
ncbi:pectinesterase-like [Camellia sinensis]|uniref:pectinesterase-like n=1 Tax=Camellia sinensis TaxID=4442 RepID=UPI001036C2F3|nr:pectinesterase-like [Camellia sinensis]